MMPVIFNDYKIFIVERCKKKKKKYSWHTDENRKEVYLQIHSFPLVLFC